MPLARSTWGFPRGRFGAILADPPWRFKTYSPRGGMDRAAANHYPTLSLAEIQRIPVAELAADDCVLFLWAIDPMLPQALETMRAWGFTYKTVAFTWAKTTPRIGTFPIGPGYWTRANPEQVLLGVRGRPKRLDRRVDRLVIEPRGAHSVKPDEVNFRIERLVAGPYIELFARRALQGWSTWGDDHRIAAGAARSPDARAEQAGLSLRHGDGPRKDPHRASRV